jgi:hypothetical protein
MGNDGGELSGKASPKNVNTEMPTRPGGFRDGTSRQASGSGGFGEQQDNLPGMA